LTAGAARTKMNMFTYIGQGKRGSSHAGRDRKEGAGMTSAAIDAADHQEIIALVHQHAWLQDGPDTERLAELYLEDGRLYGIGPERKGRAAIAEYGRKRAALKGRTARHVVSNHRLWPLEDGRIGGHLIVTLYRHDGDGPWTPEVCAIADAHDIYGRYKDGHWKLAERRLELILESEAHKRG
jgi:hypothetical protein